MLSDPLAPPVTINYSLDHLQYNRLVKPSVLTQSICLCQIGLVSLEDNKPMFGTNPTDFSFFFFFVRANQKFLRTVTSLPSNIHSLKAVHNSRIYRNLLSSAFLPPSKRRLLKFTYSDVGPNMRTLKASQKGTSTDPQNLGSRP